MNLRAGSSAEERRRNRPEAGAFESSPAHRFRPDAALGLRWGERLGDPGCPYMRRWVLNLGPVAIRLHHWRASDDDRHLHDHPWWFATLVLRGGYTDVSTDEARAATGLYVEDREVYRGVRCDHLGPGSARLRPAHHVHTVQVDPGGCWSLLITGRRTRDWGFWVDGRWLRMRRYFRDHGHHPCED